MLLLQVKPELRTYDQCPAPCVTAPPTDKELFWIDKPAVYGGRPGAEKGAPTATFENQAAMSFLLVHHGARTRTFFDGFL